MSYSIHDRCDLYSFINIFKIKIESLKGVMVINFNRVSKCFKGVLAVDNVSFGIKEGESMTDFKRDWSRLFE